MIISKRKLTGLLDSLQLEKQQDLAGDYLLINFGEPGTKPDDNDCYNLVGGGSLIIRLTEEGDVLSIEIVSH